MGQSMLLMHRTDTNFKITTCILNKLYMGQSMLLIQLTHNILEITTIYNKWVIHETNYATDT
jgi:hypothetical protein